MLRCRMQTILFNNETTKNMEQNTPTPTITNKKNIDDVDLLDHFISLIDWLNQFETVPSVPLSRQPNKRMVSSCMFLSLYSLRLLRLVTGCALIDRLFFSCCCCCCRRRCHCCYYPLILFTQPKLSKKMCSIVEHTQTRPYLYILVNLQVSTLGWECLCFGKCLSWQMKIN